MMLAHYFAIDYACRRHAPMTIRYDMAEAARLSAACAIDIAASHQPLIGCIVFQLD
jgi:hypothetical protein